MNIVIRCIKKIINNPLMFLSVCLERMPGSRFLKSLMPDKLYLKHIFRLCQGYELNLKHPRTFSEKLQWLKLYDRRPKYVTMVDKYEAKFYVSSLIGEKYIIPTLGVWNKVEDIDWDSLPNQFVMKCTHDSGGIIICKDKSKLSIEDSKQKLRRSLNHNYYLNGREWPYKNVPKRIIAEKFMASEKISSPKDLLDYKFFCFDGEPKFLYVSDTPSHSLSFLNTDWTLTDFGRDDYHPLEQLPEKPENLEEMLDIARKLSAGIPHVRVDLYNIDNHIYFGELTLYTGSGYIPFNPKEYDGKLGDLLTLPNAIGGGKYLIVNGEIKELKTEYDELKDYKFFCFNGKVKFFKVDFGRFVEHHANYYSPEGELLEFGEQGLEPDPNYPIELPDNLNEMIFLAEQLSKDIPFVRVDFYNTNGRIYFGELTFYPASGFGKWTSPDIDQKLGDLLVLF